MIDGSYNTSASPIVIPLALTIQAPPPYTYAILNFPQVIDAWVDNISNAPSGYGRALINVFFSCPMDPTDITNIANWTVSSGGNPVTVLAVTEWISIVNNAVFAAIDTLTYFAQVEVIATSATTPYFVQVTARSEDLADTTNPANYTGSINVAPLATTPRVVGIMVTPGQATVRFNRGVNLPNSLQIAGPNGSVNTSVSVSASLQSMVLAVTDMMQSYNQHTTTPYGAGHLVSDVINHFITADFPGPTVASVVGSVNRFRDVYLAHASSTIYHHYADPALITSPYATDLPSALVLTQKLLQSFVAHNINVGVHVSAGISLFSSKIYDTFVIGLGMLAGASYTMSTQSQYFYIDVGENSSPMRFTVVASFIGTAVTPYVASAIPKSAIVNTNNGVRFEKDAVIVYFSTPIQPAAAPVITIIPPGATPAPVMQGFEWVNNRVLNIALTGMITSPSYTLDVSAVQDPYCNAIESAS